MDVIWWATAAIGAIAVNLMASELFAWGPRLSERLMCGAVRRLAPEMQARMREEWAGHLQTIPPGLWRIVAAAGFYLATRQINVALRVWERQERPDEEMLHEKVSRKTEGPPILNVNVGMTKLAVLNAYVSRYAKIEGKGWVLIPGPRDEPEPQSTPRSSQDR